MKFNFIDLFCGAGGLGEGFKQAGFDSAFHVDMDEWAIQTVILREIYHVCGKDKSEFYKILTENIGTPFDTKELFSENEWLKLYEKAFKTFEFGYAAAMAYVLFTIIFILTLLQKKYVGEKVHYGG